MTYRIIYAPSVLTDIREHIQYLREQHVSDVTIEHWYTRLFKLLDDLDQMPRRYAVDRVLTEALKKETRKLNYGDYLVSYQVDDDSYTVKIIAFMHGSGRKKR